MFQLYVYGGTPPVTVTPAVPFEEPLQLTSAFVTAVIVRAGGAGSVIVITFVSLQPLASVTVNVYVPAFTFEVGPVNVYGAVPPEALTDTVVVPPNEPIVPGLALSTSWDG